MSDKEEWKTIPEHPEFLVSSFGNIKRVDGASVRVRLNDSGYLRYSVKIRGRWKEKMLHRAVLSAFSGPCPDEFECGHLNGVRTDNRAENLKWVSRKENHAHQKIHKTRVMRESHPMAKLSEKDVAYIRSNYRPNRRSNSIELAAMFGVSRGTINGVVRGDLWPDDLEALGEK